MLGRVSVQKDPREFLRVVDVLQGAGIPVEPVWIGDGDVDEVVAAGRLRTTGWLAGDELIDALSSLDLYVHSAAWEGFPIALLDAHECGTPILVRKIEAFAGLHPAQIASDSGLAGFVSAVQSDAAFEAWRTRNLELWSAYLSDNTLERQREALRAAWGEPRQGGARRGRGDQ